MSGSLPLPTLLSHALVAFTIEFDNEAEHQLPHHTTHHGSTVSPPEAPWLVSLVMWFNCMRFVDEKGITARELEQLARTKTNLNGMERWGYVLIEPDPTDRRAEPPRSSWLIRPTRAGQKAKEIWRPLLAVIEDRWGQRFGKSEIEQLRESLWALIKQMDIHLPDCLPILEYGLFSRDRDSDQRKPVDRGHDGASSLPLPSLLSNVLLAFAIEFERESEVSLAIGANVLRIVGQEGIPLRDLPRLAGVSKEGIAVSLSYLRQRGLAAVKPGSGGSRLKVVELTPKGQEARTAYLHLLPAIEQAWHTRFGEGTVRALRDALEPLVGMPDAPALFQGLFQGLKPYPDGWRASVPKPAVLPHYPMILHRGGFPDGS